MAKNVKTYTVSGERYLAELQAALDGLKLASGETAVVMLCRKLGKFEDPFELSPVYNYTQSFADLGKQLIMGSASELEKGLRSFEATFFVAVLTTEEMNRVIAEGVTPMSADGNLAIALRKHRERNVIPK